MRTSISDELEPFASEVKKKKGRDGSRGNRSGRRGGSGGGEDGGDNGGEGRGGGGDGEGSDLESRGGDKKKLRPTLDVLKLAIMSIAITAQTSGSAIALKVGGLTFLTKLLLVLVMTINLVGYLCGMISVLLMHTRPRVARVLGVTGCAATALGFLILIVTFIQGLSHIEKKNYEWIPPQKHWLKLNVDAVLGSCKAVAAAVLRHEKGSLLQYGPLR
nr:hypothetical protein CFP56_22595 [Quercus suber]